MNNKLLMAVIIVMAVACLGVSAEAVFLKDTPDTPVGGLKIGSL